MYSDRVDRDRERNRDRDRDRDRGWEDRDRRDRDRRRSRSPYEPRRRSRSPHDHSNHSLRDRERDRERSRDRYRERDVRERSRSRDRGGARTGSHGVGGENLNPQQHIVVQGLPASAKDSRVTADLEALGACIEIVRVVIDKLTGLAKGFAFVKFISTEHARQFMCEHGSTITLAGARVRLEYSKASPQSEDDWICTNCGISNFRRRVVCFQCKASKEDSTTNFGDIEMLINDGSKDVGTAPCNLLLVRDLDILTTEESFLSAVQALGVPITQVRIVKDRQTHQSYGFGFVEFSDISSAAYFLSQAMNTLVVDGRTVSICYASAMSFVQVFERNEWVTSFYQDDTPNNGPRLVFLRYRDDAAYATAHPTFMGLLDSLNASSSNAEQEQAAPTLESEEKAVFASVDDELAAFMSEVQDVIVDSTETALPTVDGPATPANEEQRLGNEYGSRNWSDEKSDAVSIEREDRDFESDFVRAHMNPARLALLTNEHPDYENIGDGGDVEELEEEAESVEESKPEEPIDLSDEALLQRLPSIETINQEKSDISLMACLLCERKFKNLDDLAKHQQKSGLHKTNIQALREIQLSDLRASLLAQIAERESMRLKLNAKKSQYRNRAAERRKMYGQPSKIPPQQKGYASYPPPSSKSRASDYGPGSGYGVERAFPIVPVQPTINGIGDDNIGNKMLKAMGWKEGSGLGAKGNGIVAPIAAEGYAKLAGVGSMPIMRK